MHGIWKMKNKKTMANIRTESDLNRIVQETVKSVINQLLTEEFGIDYDKEEKTVSFNPTHQDAVDTNDPWKPYPIYNEVDGYKVISIFERKITDDRKDGNPLIYALKGKYDWVFKNPRYDYFALLRRFVAVCKELTEEYDVIITTPSSNSLNLEILHKIIRLIPHKVHFEHFFCKFLAQDVYERTMDSNLIQKTFSNDETIAKKAIKDFENAIDNMNIENDGVFSYKFLPTYLRTILSNSMSVSQEILNDEKINELVNDKKVLIIDDTVTSGKTISDSAEALKDVFAPKDITFLTLFSPLK